MSGNDGGWLHAWIATPQALSLAGALAALIVVGAVLLWRRANGRLLLPLASLLLAAFAVSLLLDRLILSQQAAERSAFIARIAALDRSALAPGTALACLDAGAGDTVETACEKSVFASPQATAAAVAYMAARLQLIEDAAAFTADKEIRTALAASRRAVELDRFGIAADVLARRDGCTAAQCPAFALLDDTRALKANLKGQAFRHYVERHAAAWTAPAAKGPALAQEPAPAAAPEPLARADAAEPARAMPVKPGEHWDFPSAASIPPVSIMNAEPARPKDDHPVAQAQPGPHAPAHAATPLPPNKPPHKRAAPPANAPLSLSGAGN